ncbi:MAG: hypothetical protein GY797_04845 [Deltaproteobacteria bacterium]|nr:hypothetical protein [Deltaproteobacteria bacterium]
MKDNNKFWRIEHLVPGENTFSGKPEWHPTEINKDGATFEIKDKDDALEFFQINNKNHPNDTSRLVEVSTCTIQSYPPPNKPL